MNQFMDTQFAESINTPLINVAENINMVVLSLENMNNFFSSGFDVSGLRAACDKANETTAALTKMNEACEMVPASIAINPKDVIDAEFTEKEVKKDDNAQQAAKKKASLMDKLTGRIKTYVTPQIVMDTSDQLIQTSARLNMIVDDGRSIDDLQKQIYASAQQAGVDYMNNMNTVANLRLHTGDLFGSNKEVIMFAENMNKQFMMGGASQAQSSDATASLAEAMSSGTISDQTLSSLYETAPTAVQMLADYLNVSNDKLLEMAANGEITAGVFKNAMLSSTDEINNRFAAVPTTFGQMWTTIKNGAMFAFQPVLQKINEIASSPAFGYLINGVINTLGIVGNIVTGIFEMIAAVAGFVSDNWSYLYPVIMGAIALMGVYTAALAINTIAKGINAIADIGSSAAKYTAAKAALADSAALTLEEENAYKATIAQTGLNAVLWASPAFKIALLVTAIAAALYIVCEWIAKLTGLSGTGFGFIAGCINVVIQFFWNLCLTVANIAMAIWNSLCAVANNIRIAFHNTICNVQSWWYDLLATVCEVVAGIAKEINKIPFVEIDYSGVEGAAEDYRKKAEEARKNKEEYEDIGEAFHKGMNTNDAYGEGWMDTAFNSGASWGDNVMDSISGFFDSGFDMPGMMDEEKLLKNQNNDALSNTLNDSPLGSNVGSIADNTAGIQDSLDITNEDLKYLRDLAEQDAVNRFTTAEIKVEMNNNNQINSNMDLDGIANHLSIKLKEQMEIAAEGVH